MGRVQRVSTTHRTITKVRADFAAMRPVVSRTVKLTTTGSGEGCGKSTDAERAGGTYGQFGEQPDGIQKEGTGSL